MKQSPSILIVDDEQAGNAQVAEALKNSGYAVNTATDGFKALAACKVRAPDIILLDLYMPLMNGMDVLQRLKAEDKTRYIPVILLKRRDEPAPVLDKLSLEDNPILTKPLEPNDVTVLVKSLLREKTLRDELRKKEGQIKELALIDPLTSFKNQRFLTEFLKAELTQCRRYEMPLSLVLIEPDQTREILRGHGQRGLDSLLLQLAVIMSRHNRASDILARSGSSEFALALTHTDQLGATEVAERLREIIAQSTFTIGEAPMTITVSIGISQYKLAMDLEGTVLLSHARAALTEARTNGGNVSLIAE